VQAGTSNPCGWPRSGAVAFCQQISPALSGKAFERSANSRALNRSTGRESIAGDLQKLSQNKKTRSKPLDMPSGARAGCAARGSLAGVRRWVKKSEKAPLGCLERRGVAAMDSPFRLLTKARSCHDIEFLDRGPLFKLAPPSRWVIRDFRARGAGGYAGEQGSPPLRLASANRCYDTSASQRPQSRTQRIARCRGRLEAKRALAAIQPAVGAHAAPR